MGIRGITCGLRADHTTSRISVGRSDWAPKYWRGSLVMSGALVVLSGT